ncbi:PepSY domain-containing protein [Chryseotalea sanaruensis]|uniref:PepSY domain-containing protein n=1 Tax=Chryseotalea sanaruensis TaxID=2482724 RepID=A0A401U4Z0_9BACT|nr:PepSY-associated TM helix domain-containing protein [Chryseotalea sanaruensis]GCC49925.1 PepSY domain-containing protein [Chryseotalea sanaruensis]
MQFSFKKIAGKLHLWLGLTSGLVVFIVSITGCIYAFQYDLQELTQDYRHVVEQHTAFLPPSMLKDIAEAKLPGKKIHGVQYEGTTRAAFVSFYELDPFYYYLVYINPYTGEVLKVKNMSHDFFYQVLQGHYYLWLPPTIGQPVVATSCLIFLIMLITGIVLWWPKKNKAKQRFTIKWNARWRRKNYDLHNVFGFYSLFITLILAITGLVWGFQWFGVGVYLLAGGDKTAIYEEQSTAKTTPTVSQPVDVLWAKLKAENPKAEILEVHFPESDTGSIAATINPDRLTYWKADYRFFNQYTLAEIEVNQIYGKRAKASGADKLIRMNYDIHTGAIMGFAGKLLAFFASLIAASLPVTGTLIWWGRRNKKKVEKAVSEVNLKSFTDKKEVIPA